MSVLKFVIFVGSLFLHLFIPCLCACYFILFMNVAIANKRIFMWNREKLGRNFLLDKGLGLGPLHLVY